MVRANQKPVTTTLEVDKFIVSAQSLISETSTKFGDRVRTEKLLEAIHRMEGCKTELVSLVSEETGKSLQLSISEFDAAVQYTKMLCYGTLGEGGYLTSSNKQEKSVEIKSAPFGLALLITAYNTPLPNLFWKLAPSFLAGNYSLFCPSPHVYSSAKKVIDLFHASGITPEEISVTDGNPQIADYASRRPEFRLISFTGSVEVGKKVSSNCSQSYPKLILELGGVNPTIIGSTSSVLEATKAALTSAFSNGGQRCAAGSIVICTDSSFPEFENCIEELKNSKDFRSELQLINTPLISEASTTKHIDYLNRVRKDGGVVTELGEFSNEKSIKPALVREIRSNSSLSFEEVFSPILRIFRASDIREAIDLANRSPLRLTAAFWTDSLSEARLANEQLSYGLVNLNGFTFGSEPNFPFGGLGLSGNGSRDAGYFAPREYAQTIVRTIRT
jgi:aldehyde dehydrogenase (NAD+)